MLARTRYDDGVFSGGNLERPGFAPQVPQSQGPDEHRQLFIGDRIVDDGRLKAEAAMDLLNDLKAGYKIVDPGRYPDGNDNFSTQISKFKAADAQILTGVPIPPDFTTFWTQALQQGYHPKVASVGKALLFPSAVEALGSHGVGLSTELWWSPFHPYKSSLTGQSAKEFIADLERLRKKEKT